MTKYNSSHFDPPAPVAYVTLRNKNLEWANVPMQLDSGADVTLIPQFAVAKINLEIIAAIQYELVGFDGNISYASAAELNLIFCRRTFRGKYLLADRDIGVLGRDILNLVPLVFDGPSLDWSEYKVKK